MTTTIKLSKLFQADDEYYFKQQDVTQRPNWSRQIDRKNHLMGFCCRWHFEVCLQETSVNHWHWLIYVSINTITSPHEHCIVTRWYYPDLNGWFLSLHASRLGLGIAVGPSQEMTGLNDSGPRKARGCIWLTPLLSHKMRDMLDFLISSSWSGENCPGCPNKS